MADRYQRSRYNQSDRQRGAPDYQDQGYRQQEQFSSGNERSPEGYETSYGQMGDTAYRDDFGQTENRYDSDWDRNERYGQGGGYGRQDREPRATGNYNYGPARYEAPGRGFASFTSEDQQGRDFSAPTHREGYGSYGERMGLSPARNRYQRGGGNYTGADGHRGWFDRASDEVASWFGDEQAEHRREMDHRGRGPQNYSRSDERILEDACDNLTDDWAIDARNVQVTVKEGEVTLDGTVSSRAEKRRAEDCVDCISGVGHVQNNLRVEDRSDWDRNETIATEQRAEQS